MSLTDLANLGEFFSSIAVLGSLIYVAVQIRQAERNQRASIQAERAARVVNLNMGFADESNATILNKGVGGDGITTLDELYRFQRLVTAYMRSTEDLFLQHGAGLIEDDLYEAARGRVRRMSASVGFRVCWKSQRDDYSKRFRDFIDREMDQATIAPAGDPVAQWHEMVAAERAAING